MLACRRPAAQLCLLVGTASAHAAEQTLVRSSPSAATISNVCELFQKQAVSSIELDKSLYSAAADNDVDQVRNLVKLPNVKVNATRGNGRRTALRRVIFCAVEFNFKRLADT